MQAVILLLFVVISFASFAAESLGAPQILRYSPELMSALALVYVALRAARRGLDLVAPKYWLSFGALSLVIICGIIANGVGAAPVLNGIRFYCRALPFFFLPAVTDFSQGQIEQQLRALCAIGLLQCPLAIFQRWVILSHGRYSGDDVRGTLLDSGTLSIFLICATLVAAGMCMRGRVGRWQLAILGALLLLPTAIDETKATLIFLPIGVVVALLVGARQGQRVRTLFWSLLALSAFAGAFIPVYNAMEANSPYNKDKNIVGFLSNQKEVEHYLSSNVQGVGTNKIIGRGDAITVPMAYIAQDPIHLALGLGLGNVSPSTRGENFEGTFYELFSGFLLTSFTYFILEIGVLGMCIVLLLYGQIFRDALVVSRQPGLYGGLAVGWTATTAVMLVALVYSPIHLFESLSYLFWYISGLIGSHRRRFETAEARVAIRRAYVAMPR